MADESKDDVMDSTPAEVPRVGFAKLLHGNGAIVLTTKDKVVLGRKHKGDADPHFHAIGAVFTCVSIWRSRPFVSFLLGSSKNISRSHAELFVENDTWMIQCVSKNGIDVNGTTIYNGLDVFVVCLCSCLLFGVCSAWPRCAVSQGQDTDRPRRLHVFLPLCTQ